MLTTAEQIEAQRRIDAVDLVVRETDCVENVLHCDFWARIDHDRREARKFLKGELDYLVDIDVTENVPDMQVNDYVCVGGDEPKEVYMVCAHQEEILGRKIWTFVAEFSSGLPVRKAVSK